MIRPPALSLLLLAACASTSATGRSAAPAVSAEDRPALVVLLTVDQLTPVFFERWGHQLTGGLARFHREGLFYPNAEHAHAVTETAPGHATIGSGRFPASTNIYSNADGVSDPDVSLVGMSGTGASPARFRGSSVLDWMRAADSGTRVLSISRKDRGAILPLGRATGDVYWWWGGSFTTSTYYADTLPAWLQASNAAIRGEDFAGRQWTLLLPESEYTYPDSMPYENAGFSTFPHVLPAEPDRALARLLAFPWMDSLTLHVAVDGVRALQLGRRGAPDLLAISLSTTDAVGHAFGPNSREIQDQILRLDRWLGAFLDTLATIVPADRQLLVLTSDHGVTTMPEYLEAIGRPAGGRGNIRNAVSGVAASFGLESHEYALDDALVLVDPAALTSRRIDRARFESALVAALRDAPGVDKVFTPRTLLAAARSDQDAEYWRRSIPPGLPWAAAVVTKPGWHFRRVGGADHSTMQPETRSVPIAFLRPGRPGALLLREARTVDIAPTIAALLGIRPDAPVDGVVLRDVVEALRR